MAEFDCFLTRDEFAALLETAFADGFRLCINKNLPQAMPEYVTEKNTIHRLLEMKQHAFILERDDFTRHPITMRPFERGGMRMWYPRPTEGGPVIEAIFFAPSTKGNARIIPCSLLACPTKIVNPSSGLEEAAGGAVRKAYVTLVAPMRARFKRVRSAKRGAYVSPGAQAMIDAGWKLAQPFDSKQPN